MGDKGFLKMAAVAMAMVLMAGCSGSDSEKPTIKVFQSDASLQCESAGISLEDMRKVLDAANVPVHCAQKGHTGRMYMALCGSPTGNINIYTIPEAQLEQAQRLGFAAVSTLVDYQDMPCEV